MAKIVAIHSFRPGTGKSNVTANIATLLAAAGLRVAIIDSAAEAPALHTLFGVGPETLRHTLNDFLWGRCDLRSTASDIASAARLLLDGALYLVPFAIASDKIDYDVSLLSDSFQLLIQQLGLDLLIIDSQPGLRAPILPSIAFADLQIIILRTDEEDYQGTGVALDIAHELGVPDAFLVVNQVPVSYDRAEVEARVQETYRCAVIGVIPQADEMAQLANQGLFVLHHPQHPITRELTAIAAVISAEA